MEGSAIQQKNNITKIRKQHKTKWKDKIVNCDNYPSLLIHNFHLFPHDGDSLVQPLWGHPVQTPGWL